MKILEISIEKDAPEYIIYQVKKTSFFRKLFGITPTVERFKRSTTQVYAHFSSTYAYFNEKGETLPPWDKDIKAIESWRNRF